MIPTRLLLYVANGVIELISLVICVNIIGVLHIDKFEKTKVILSATEYISILIFIFFIQILSFSFGPLVVILYYLNLVTAIFILYGHINFGVIYLVAVLDFLISLIKTNIYFIFSNIAEKSLGDVSLYVKLFIQIIILILILLAKRKGNIHRIAAAFAIIPKHIYVMLISTIGLLHLLSSLISFQTEKTMFKEIFSISFVIILTVIMMCIVASLISNVIAKQHFTAVSQMMEKQVELQLNHYNELEKLDTEMSRFRHDYTNHLQSILSLIQMTEYSQAEEYIQKLKKEKYKSELHMFYTGSKLADAILSDKASVLGEDGRIEYSGIIPPSIEYVDLCTVLSNSLDNAVEACRKLSSPGVISIHAAEQQGYFVLSVRNPTVCTENYYTIPATTKDDKEHHGMGLYNIESTVKKHDGQMKIKCENGFFELMITMKS